MDPVFETKFRIIKKLVLLTGEQAKSLASKHSNLNYALNLYHNLAVDYNLLTTYYFSKKNTNPEDDVKILEKIKITLSQINPDYNLYLEKI